MVRNKYTASDSHNVNTRSHSASKDEHAMPPSDSVNSKAEVGDHNEAPVSSYGSHMTLQLLIL